MYKLLNFVSLFLQALSEVPGIIIKGVLPTTCVCHLTQFIANINLVFKDNVLEFMVLNIKPKMLMDYYFPATCTSTMFHAQFVMSRNVLLKSWYQVVTCVQWDGDLSTKDTSWREDTLTIVQCIHAWMKKRFPQLIVVQMKTAHCFISLKENVAHFPVHHMSTGASCRAQYALVKYEHILIHVTFFTL